MASPNVTLNDRGVVRLTDLGIPQDILDAAAQVGVDVETVVSLCIKHTVDAVRDLLSLWITKLPTA